MPILVISRVEMAKAKQMKPRHRAIWSGLFRFGRNLADEGLAILRPSNTTPCDGKRC